MPPIILHHPHPWDLSPEVAIRLQQELRAYVLIQPLPLDSIRRVGGVDVGYPAGGTARAAVVVMSFPDLRVVEQAVVDAAISFPYRPGLLAFRENPTILAALSQLEALPDVLIVDGHGLAHPRRFGIACHLGVLLDRPTVGCAKSILLGEHGLPDELPGNTADMMDDNEVVGAASRTRQGVKPVYVSAGHRTDLATAVRLVLACGRGYRLPEPTRLADHLASHRQG